jgi:hypothetical protein
VPRRLDSEYLCAIWLVQQTGKELFFTMCYSLRVFTASNNDHGGDWNCVRRNSDCNGNINVNKGLETIISDFGLVDVRWTVHSIAVYTH